MSMPPQGAFVVGDVESVGEVLVGLDGTLGNHRHPVIPAVPPLPHPMPNTKAIKIPRLKPTTGLRCYLDFFFFYFNVL